MTKITAWANMKDVDSLDVQKRKEREERRLLGFKIRILLDYGRLLYLENHGYKGKLIPYTSKSKENILILAKKNNYWIL